MINNLILTIVKNQNLIPNKMPKPTNDTTFLIPLFAALAGGLIVVIGQSIDRYYRLKAEKINTLRNIYSECRRLEALMKNNYRELAMAKVHIEYWWYCHQTESNSKYSDRYYEEHLNGQIMAREVERRIGETKAEFIGQVKKFQSIKKLKSVIDNELLIISDLNNYSAKSYDSSLKYEKVRDELVDRDEDDLRNLYYNNLFNFQSINNYLETLL